MFNLPVEILSEIFFYLSPKDAIKMYLCSKKSYRFLDPSEKNGMYIWKRYRQALLFPNPNQINLTDFMFLKAYYTRGCNGCKKHPKMRKIFWEFHAKKMCEDCLARFTIKDYLIQSEERERITLALPRIEKIGYARYYGETFYSLFLLDDLYKLDDIMYIFERKSVYYNLPKFLEELHVAEEHNKEIEENIKINKIDKILRAYFDEKDMRIIKNLRSYHNAILNSKSNFTSKRSRILLKNSVEKELNRKKKIRNIKNMCKSIDEICMYDRENKRFFYSLITRLEDIKSDIEFDSITNSILFYINKQRYQDDLRKQILIRINWKAIKQVSDKEIISNEIFKYHYDSISEYYTEQKIEDIANEIYIDLHHHVV